MRRYTVNNVMAANPCKNNYPRKRIEQLFAGQDYLTLDDLPELDIPDKDKLWTLINVVSDDRQRRLLAADCAERALLREREAGREPDPRSWRATDVARKFAEGQASHEELMAAGAAANAAMVDACSDADASEVPEMVDAAWAAWAAMAADAAASAWIFAADSTARRDELKWQLERAMEYAREEGTTAPESA